MSGQLVEYVEIDIPVCSLTYGVAPCTASLVTSPVTGTRKCFNCFVDCQDQNHYDEDIVTLRFARDAEFLPRDIEALPWLIDSDFSPAIVSLGTDLGQRAGFTATFTDHAHSDVGPGLDKYHAERGYDPYERGTFWGRFRARQPYLRGHALRWIKGFVGQSLAEMETRHFFIDSIEGPGADAQFKIIAKDVLKLLDGDRAQAPVLSNGFLVADITNSATSATLSPSGIGNTEYPVSGHVCVAGNEVCAFTRSGDTLTLTRGQLGTAPSSHSAQDRVQLVLRYAAEDPADILYDLMVNYAGLPAGYITLSDWQAETAAYLNRVYTATLVEPVSVATLVSELIEQGALAVWDDNVAQKLRLQVLRGILTDADRYSADNVEDGTFTVEDQPDKRLSQVQVFFGLIDPTKSVTDQDNYRSASGVIDEVAEENYGAAIKQIFSRWIPQFGRTVADRIGAIQIGRYRDPPRKVTLKLLRGSGAVPEIGRGYRAEWQNLQDATGALADLPLQITRLNADDVYYSIEAEEMQFVASSEDLSNRQITIDFDSLNVNLRSVHDTLFPAPVTGDTFTITCTVTAGATVGSIGASQVAFDVGSWPVGVTVNVVLNGRIEGAGGQGGPGGAATPAGGNPGGDGEDGGVALYARRAINLSTAAGQIFGGGGGGGGGAGSPFLTFGTAGGSGGGGGGGANGGTAGSAAPGGSNGAAGTRDAGGAGGAGISFGGPGGGGGDPGHAGSNGSVSPAAGSIPGGTGGAPGAAIDGVSFVTVITGPGDIRGSQIN